MVKVSILMPVYNTHESYLREAIQSILSQTYEDYEFLILNDCSPDENIEKIIKSYNDERIKYMKNFQNMGISPTRNKLVELATGEYLAVMDHDDISLPERLKKQVEFLDSNADYGVVGSWHGLVGTKKIKELPVEDEKIQKTLFLKCCICHPATMIRKSVLVNNNIKYNKIYSPSEDYAIWGNLVGKTKFYNIPEVLFMYRKYDTNTSHKQNRQMSEATFKIKELMKRENPLQWNLIKDDSRSITTYKLFGKVNLLTSETFLNNTDYKLFGKILLFRVVKKIKSK